MSLAEPTAAPRSSPLAGLASAVERALLQRLRYGLFWVVTGCGWYVTFTLALIQTRYPEAFKQHPLAPVSRVLLVVEGALWLTALLMTHLASRPRLSAALESGEPGHLAAGLSGGIMLLLQFTLQLSPLLFLYRAPELVVKGINIPLMMLQRGVLVCLCALAAYHVLLALRLQFRAPLLAAFPATLALYMWGTYALVKLSLSNATFQQLNDVFYWNQLSLHIDTLPAIYTERIVDKIEPQYLGYFLMLGLIGCVVTLLLWIPAAVKTDARETRGELASKPGRRRPET